MTHEMHFDIINKHVLVFTHKLEIFRRPSKNGREQFKTKNTIKLLLLKMKPFLIREARTPPKKLNLDVLSELEKRK
jgi:hypothetical protein